MPNGTMYDFSVDTMRERYAEQRHPIVAAQWAPHVEHHGDNKFPNWCYWCQRGRLATT